MDPYLDTIPDDHGQDIKKKKRVRERDDPDNGGRLTHT